MKNLNNIDDIAEEFYLKAFAVAGKDRDFSPRRPGVISDFKRAVLRCLRDVLVSYDNPMEEIVDYLMDKVDETHKKEAEFLLYEKFYKDAKNYKGGSNGWGGMYGYTYNHCPLCEFDDKGRMTKGCVLHKEINRLELEISKLNLLAKRVDHKMDDLRINKLLEEL